MSQESWLVEASGQEGKNATTGYFTNVEARILQFGVQNEQPKKCVKFKEYHNIRSDNNYEHGSFLDLEINLPHLICIVLTANIKHSSCNLTDWKVGEWLFDVVILLSY